jgi:hypothetical protein
MGMIAIFRQEKNRKPLFLLLVCPVAGVYLLHGVLGTFGLFGSLSMPRYYITIAPIAAVLVLVGLRKLEASSLSRRAVLAFFFSAIFLAAAAPAVELAVGLAPIRKNVESRRLEVVVDELRRMGNKEEIAKRLIVLHPYIGYALDVAIYMPNINGEQALKKLPVGTLLVSDSELWVKEGMPSADQLEAAGFRRVASVWEKTQAFKSTPSDGTFYKLPNGVCLWIKE